MVRHWRLALAALIGSGFFWATPEVEEAGAVSGTRFIAADSSNFSRRSSRSISKIVIHTIEGSEGGAISWFQNPRSNVSAHYIVSHAGRITQMVRDRDVAWHARGVNFESIGIENEGYAGRNGWTDVQMNTLARVVRELCDQYGIPKNRRHIIGHHEVSGSGKSDPGRFFDWDRLIRQINGGKPSSPPPSGTPATYTVRSGDTLNGIAARFGTSASALARLNGISNPSLIRVGQVLRLPQGSTTPTTPPPAPTDPRGRFAVEVTASALNVRSGVWGAVLGQVARGERFVVDRQRSGWYRIAYRGRDAWVSGRYVRRVSGPAAQVNVSSLNVRTGPSTGWGIMGQVHRGEAYAVVGRSGSWLLIQFDGRRGYVHGNYAREMTLR